MPLRNYRKPLCGNGKTNVFESRSAPSRYFFSHIFIETDFRIILYILFIFVFFQKLFSVELPSKIEFFALIIYNGRMVLKNFIVFEGIDGSGTTTQVKKLAEKNSSLFFETAEPTSLETGLFLRRMLKGDFSVDERTNAFLFAADRCEHIFGKDGIITKINEGKTVLSDRYFFSSLAYQSLNGNDEYPKMLNSLFPLPQILFYFEIDAETAMKRIQKRNAQSEIYERLDLQKKIAAQYEKIIREYEEKNTHENDENQMKIIRIDAAKSAEEIAEKIFCEVKNEIKI